MGYWDKPDGTDCVEKTWITTKLSTALGKYQHMLSIQVTYVDILLEKELKLAVFLPNANDIGRKKLHPGLENLSFQLFLYVYYDCCKVSSFLLIVATVCLCQAWWGQLIT